MLRAIGNREAHAILLALLEAETTQTSLGHKTKLATGTLAQTLEMLAQAGLIERRPGTQGAWRVSLWPETLAVLSAARRLAIALAGVDEHASADERELLVRLEEAGGAIPAARRGGSREDDG